MSTTMASITGHFTMFHTVTGMEPSPIASPTAVASGPLTTRPSSTSATRTTAIRVTSSCTGRSFQTGRPSPTS